MANRPDESRAHDSPGRALVVRVTDNDFQCEVLEKLARLEAKCALEALYTRWPNLALAVAPQAVHWRRRPGMRSIISLPVMPSGSAAASAAHSVADTPHRDEVATS